MVVNYIHDRNAGDVARFEERLTVRVDDGVVGVDLSVDELLHDVRDVPISLGKEFGELLLIFQLVCRHRADAVVRLDDNGPAYLFYEFAAAFLVAYHVEARGGYPGAAVVFLHT